MLNINNKLLAGGYYCGGENWNKNASSLDKCFKIYEVTEGSAFLFTGDKKYELDTGRVYFVNGYRIQRQICPHLFGVNWLHFISDSIFIKQALLSLPVVTELDSVSKDEQLTEFSLFRSYFGEISGRDKSLDPAILSAYFNIQSLVLKIMGKLIDKSGAETFQMTAQGGRLLKAVEFINTNYKSTVTLKQLAGLCFMSENYFHSLFKKEFTVTPNNYILQLRMNEALNLLSNTGLSAKEVARECGYPDAAYFSRTFSKYFGLSPKRYRGLHSVRLP